MSVRTVVASRWAKTNPFDRAARDRRGRLRRPPTATPCRPSSRARSSGQPRGRAATGSASPPADAVGDRAPSAPSVAGNEIVAWRSTDGTLQVGPGSCPHLGADLSTGAVDCGTLICPWHGLRLSGRSAARWTRFRPTTTACWPGCASTTSVAKNRPTRPVLPDRPDGARLHAVTRLVGICEPPTSSPTVWTRGTAPGSIPTRSPASTS